jgi:hypothetical protein
MESFELLDFKQKAKLLIQKIYRYIALELHIT